MVVLGNWDALDVVVMAGDVAGADELLAVGVLWATEAADVADGVLWATEAADEAFELLGVTEAADEAFELLGVTEAADDAVGLLGATEAADEAIGTLVATEAAVEAIGLLRATGAVAITIELLRVTGVTDDVIELLGATRATDVAIELLGAIGAADDAMELLGIMAAADEAMDALGARGTADDIIELLGAIRVADVAIELLGMTEAADVAIGLLRATDTDVEAIRLLVLAGADVDTMGLLRAIEAAYVGMELLRATEVAGVDIGLLEATEAADNATELLTTTGATDVAIGLLEATIAVDDIIALLVAAGTVDTAIELLGTITTLEDGNIELDTATTWLVDTDWDTVIEEPAFVAARVLWGAIEVAVAALTTITLDVIGAAEDIGWLVELTTAIRVFEGTMLEDETTEGITLDAEAAMLEGATLDGSVETIWLDEPLTGAWEVAEDPATEPLEGFWDTGRMLVAPLTATILVIGVDETMGKELEALPITTATLEDVGTWLSKLLLVWVADVAADTTTEVVKAPWLELIPTTTTLVTADGVEIIDELTPLLTGTAAPETVLLNTGEAVWLITLLGWARIGDPLTRLVVVGIVWAILDALDTPWDVDKITVEPELPIIEPTAVVAEFAALAETCVEATEPAPTSARLLPPAVCTTATLVLPTPTFTR
jgi:hypothetical protein